MNTKENSNIDTIKDIATITYTKVYEGHLKFSGAIYSAPFPSMIVIWEPEEE